MKYAPVFMFVLLTSCGNDISVTVNPSVTTYARDARTDICFATIGRQIMDTGGKVSNIFSVAAVPCSPAVLALVPKSQGGSKP